MTTLVIIGVSAVVIFYVVPCLLIEFFKWAQRKNGNVRPINVVEEIRKIAYRAASEEDIVESLRKCLAKI